MYLSALTIGAAVPPGEFQGEVHTVFRSVVNLRLAGCDTLVTLHSSPETDLPQGIRMAPGAGFSTSSFARGQRVWRSGPVLFLPSAGWQVNLSSARVWPCDWSEAQLDFSAPAVQGARVAVQAHLHVEQRCAGEGKGSVLASAAAVPLAEGPGSLREAAAALDGEAARRAARTLAGLGSGLTPAGDDMLVGFAAGLRACAAKNEQRWAFIEIYNQALREAAARTNDISRTYLLLAARGMFSSSVMDLLRAIGRGETGEGLAQATQRLLNTGHSSGRDTLEGLMAGLHAWG